VRWVGAEEVGGGATSDADGGVAVVVERVGVLVAERPQPALEVVEPILFRYSVSRFVVRAYGRVATATLCLPNDPGFPLPLGSLAARMRPSPR
jgi:hypothetical protein